MGIEAGDQPARQGMSTESTLGRRIDLFDRHPGARTFVGGVGRLATGFLLRRQLDMDRAGDELSTPPPLAKYRPS